MIQLRQPEVCPDCQSRGEVLKTETRDGGYRYRRYACPACGERWTSYETLLNPRRLRIRKPAADRPVVSRASR